MKSKWVVGILAAIYIFIVFNRQADWSTNRSVLAWDKFGYYSYLPATFIYKDLKGLSYYNDILYVYQFTNRGPWFGAYEQPNGNRLNKYAIGVSCFELPFFAVAHIYNKWAHIAEPDGYSLPYQWAMFFSTVFWSLTGLIFLRKFLLQYFTDGTTAITLFCIGLGTNLYAYTAFDPCMSHPYSFMLFAALLYYMGRWQVSYSDKYLYAMAIVLGFITIVRPINITVVILPLLWGISDKQGLTSRLKLLINRPGQLFIALCCFLAVALIQMSYWKYITGHWVYYSYEGEGFYFLEPEVINGLFSFRKGWFVYTPMAFVGILGFYSLYKKDKRLVAGPVLSLLALIYIVFSWYCWWYGGSFGCRALIEALAIVAIPLAALTETVLTSAKKGIKIIYGTLIIFLAGLNVFQTYQFTINIIPWDKMTSAYYWRVFGKLKADPADEKYLMSDKEFWESWSRKTKK